MKKYKNYIVYTIILIFLIIFAILVFPKLYLERQIQNSGTAVQAVVLGTGKNIGLCSVRFSYKVPMPDGKVKGFVEERNVPCSSEAIFKNLRFGSEVVIKYLSSAPEKSNIEGNTLIWWLFLVRALTATIGLVGFVIFLKIIWPDEQKFSPKNIIVGTIALGIASASSMIALVGLEHMDGVLIVGLLLGITAPLFIVARWINHKLYSFMQDKLNAKSNTE